MSEDRLIAMLTDSYAQAVLRNEHILKLFHLKFGERGWDWPKGEE